jgi:hypothetical protein
MADRVGLSNLALQHIGEDDRIVSPDEDSRPARAIRTAWDLTYEFVLAEANWGFATLTLAIGKRAVHPDFPIALERNAFPLPPDLVRFGEVIEPDLNDETDAFSIEGGPNGSELLAAEDGPITIRYVANRAEFKDPARWPSLFCEAFAFRLAWQISDALAADKARKDRAFDGSEKALSRARRANNRMKARKGNASTPWSRSRRSSAVPIPGVDF